MKNLFLKENAFHGDNFFNFSIYEIVNMDDRQALIHRHWHEEMELLFVKKGPVYLKIAQKQLLLPNYSLVFIPSECVHEVLNSHADIKEVYSFVFGKDLIQQPHNLQSVFNTSALDDYKILYLDNQDQTLVAEKLHDIIESYHSHRSGAEFFIRGHLFLIFYYLFLNSETYFNKSILKEDMLDYRVESIIQFIKNRYQDHITVDDIANELNITNSYFCRFFKKEFGCTFTEYLTDYRLSKAKLLLRTSNIPLIDVGLSCGFNSSSYFSTVFTNKLNLTPGQYRKKYQP